jgi:hypothetical protein
MSCSTCGAALVLDPRARRESCSTCHRAPAVCPCRPVVSVPEWRRRLTSKDLTGSVMAA